MAFVTHRQIVAEQRVVAKSRTTLLAEADSTEGKRVFLAHAHVDVDALAGLLALLDRLRAPAYIDERDDTMPKITSSVTAGLLRARMIQLPKFLLAASGSIRDSRWTPWELGFADAKKGLDHVALFPLERPNGTLAIDQEYLAFYPYVELIPGSGYVVRTSSAAVNLETWLRR